MIKELALRKLFLRVRADTVTELINQRSQPSFYLFTLNILRRIGTKNLGDFISTIFIGKISLEKVRQ
jgi:hypothetical protein